MLSSGAMSSMHAGACAYRTDSPGRISEEAGREKKSRGKDLSFCYDPEKTRASRKGEAGGTRTRGFTAGPRNDIQPYVSTGRASVVNLSRSSFGSGEIIVRSRNSKRRPGRPLPRDYINAVSVSRRLRIGRCSPSFPRRLETKRLEYHVGITRV